MTIELYISQYGNVYWFNNQYRHNNYTPAIKNADGSSTYWYKHGKYHRLTGPAITWANGSKFWCVDDVKYGTYLEYLIAVETFKQTN